MLKDTFKDRQEYINIQEVYLCTTTLFWFSFFLLTFCILRIEVRRVVSIRYFQNQSTILCENISFPRSLNIIGCKKTQVKKRKARTGLQAQQGKVILKFHIDSLLSSDKYLLRLTDNGLSIFKFP